MLCEKDTTSCTNNQVPQAMYPAPPREAWHGLRHGRLLPSAFKLRGAEFRVYSALRYMLSDGETAEITHADLANFLTLSSRGGVLTRVMRALHEAGYIVRHAERGDRGGFWITMLPPLELRTQPVVCIDDDQPLSAMADEADNVAETGGPHGNHPGLVVVPIEVEIGSDHQSDRPTTGDQKSDRAAAPPIKKLIAPSSMIHACSGGMHAPSLHNVAPPEFQLENAILNPTAQPDAALDSGSDAYTLAEQPAAVPVADMAPGAAGAEASRPALMILPHQLRVLQRINPAYRAADARRDLLKLASRADVVSPFAVIKCALEYGEPVLSQAEIDANLAALRSARVQTTGQSVSQPGDPPFEESPRGTNDERHRRSARRRQHGTQQPAALQARTIGPAEYPDPAETERLLRETEQRYGIKLR